MYAVTAVFIETFFYINMRINTYISSHFIVDTTMSQLAMTSTLFPIIQMKFKYSLLPCKTLQVIK